MTEAHLGRLLLATLHQAITVTLPARLDFYEHWLNSAGMRAGTIGLAPMVAVLGFLRTEGDDYARVVARAGELAAEWTVASMPEWQRRLIHKLPRGIRSRMALRLAAQIVRHVSSASRTKVSIRRGRARLEIRPSLFCAVREVPKQPLCGFYSSLAGRILSLFDIAGRARIAQCQALSAQPSCVIEIDLTPAATETATAAAA